MLFIGDTCVAVTGVAAACFLFAAASPARAADDPGLLPADLCDSLHADPDRAIRVETPGRGIIEIVRHHGDAYQAWEAARLEGRVREGAVLVHLDAHDDMNDMTALAPRPVTVSGARRIRYDIAGFIVPALAHGLVDEVFFVRHDGTAPWRRYGRTDAFLIVVFEDRWGVEVACIVPAATPDVVAAVRARVARFPYWTGEPDVKITRTRRVRIRSGTVDELPVFVGERRDVILDVDEDYYLFPAGIPGDRFATRAETRSAVDGRVRRSVRVLDDRGVSPAVVTIALSPSYAPRAWMPYITERLVSALDAVGVARVSRSEGGGARVMTVALPDPSVDAIRAVRAAWRRGDARATLAAADAVMAAHGRDATDERARGRARSPFTSSVASSRREQPSPVVVLSQRAFNAVAEARYLRAKAFGARGETEARARELDVIVREFDGAYLPLREYGDDIGRAREGWWNAAAIARVARAAGDD